MLSLVTITARPDPMFELMLTGLQRAILHFEHWYENEHAPGESSAGLIEWVVVDAQLWYDAGRAGVLEQGKPCPIQHVPPKPSRWHGPHRDPKVADFARPDQNGARNTGILHARGDYVILLDDCSYVSERFFEVAWRARLDGEMLIYPHSYVGHPVTERDRPPVAYFPGVGWGKTQNGVDGKRRDATGLRGSGVAYPLGLLLDLNGYDEAYSGQPREDVELGIRACRLTGKLPIWVNDAWVCEQKAGQAEIFPEGITGSDRNEGLTSRLMGDVENKRTWPLGNDFNLRELRAQLVWK